MTAYAEMSGAELRTERERWQRIINNHSRRLLDALKADDGVWQAIEAGYLEAALAQEHKLERLLRLGIAA